MKGLAITVMFSLLQFGCAKESEVLNGPFLIKDGVTFDQMTNQSVSEIILDFNAIWCLANSGKSTPVKSG